MSATCIVWLCIYISGLLLSLFRGPIYALLIYMFTFYTQFNWAKELMRNRLSMYAALVMLISYFLHKHKLVVLAQLKAPPMKWLLLLLADMLFVSPFAVDPVHNQRTIELFLKLIVLYYMIVCIIRTRKEYKWFLWLQLWGNYFFGWKGYQKGTEHGRLEGIGGPSTSTSNDLANHMLVIVPFLNNFLFFGNKWEKAAAIWAAPFIVNALIQCNSRGAFLGLVTMVLFLIIKAPAKHKKKIIAGMILGGILFMHLTNQSFWTRMSTIDDYGGNKDSSEGRITTWLGAIEMIKDHPFGKGGDSFMYYSPVYIPKIVEAHGGQTRSVHNSYLQIATNWGIPGIFFYIMFLFSTFSLLRKTKKLSKELDNDYITVECTAIEIGLAGFLIAALFGARPYAEVLYWYSALACVLNNIQLTELQKHRAQNA